MCVCVAERDVCVAEREGSVGDEGRVASRKPFGVRNGRSSNGSWQPVICVN
jgi:hypothetical protein